MTYGRGRKLQRTGIVIGRWCRMLDGSLWMIVDFDDDSVTLAQSGGIEKTIGRMKIEPPAPRGTT